MTTESPPLMPSDLHRNEDKDKIRDGDMKMMMMDTIADESVASSLNGGQTAQEEREVIAKEEGRMVLVLRVVVLLVLVASAIGVSLGVYYYITNQEEDSFQAKFDADATKVLESIGSTVRETLGATDAFITQLVAYARYSDGDGWPFVTLPAFAIHATKLLKLSKSFHFSLNTFVEPDQKDEWEQYANASDAWIYESLAIQARDKDWHGPNEKSFRTSYKIYDFSQPNHTEPYDYMNNFCPSWQTHPMVPSSGAGLAYNFDAWQIADLATGLVHADEEKKVVVSPHVNAIYDPTSEASIAAAKGQSDWASAFTKPGLDPNEPFSVITFPIYDSLEDVRLDVTKDLPYVGVIIFSLYWREMIEDILPDGEALVVVFESACAPAFTYRLDGNEAIFLGQGDLHDPAFDTDDKHYSAGLHELANKGLDSSYTGLPISESYCPWTVHVYPSIDMEEAYMTKDPIWFTLGAVSIFLFTSLVFILYDHWSNRRQRITLKRALASGAIVNSLYPQNVREQLYAQGEQEQQQQKEQKKDLKGTSSLATAALIRASSNRNLSEERVSSKPIADHFDETTIFFADLVGFTAWASKRSDPAHVFELLEAIYGRMDSIALRRKVFKVETIGDCYVAVTGIPDKQPNHASIMARFATDCLAELKEVLHEIANSLGEDCLDLNMRVGLHSGKTIAGVLRGRGNRFALFGDSVNTCARMESNGKPGHIQCSEATANALRLLGKETWLIPREDKVLAKGKGEMQTFWIQIPVANPGSSSVERSVASDGDKEVNQTLAEASTVNAN